MNIILFFQLVCCAFIAVIVLAAIALYILNRDVFEKQFKAFKKIYKALFINNDINRKQVNSDSIKREKVEDAEFRDA
jgi:hypothetical protein